MDALAASNLGPVRRWLAASSCIYRDCVRIMLQDFILQYTPEAGGRETTNRFHCFRKGWADVTYYGINHLAWSSIQAAGSVAVHGKKVMQDCYSGQERAQVIMVKLYSYTLALEHIVIVVGFIEPPTRALSTEGFFQGTPAGVHVTLRALTAALSLAMRTLCNSKFRSPKKPLNYYIVYWCYIGIM